jgi:AcrR family transcriptional regulator
MAPRARSSEPSTARRPAPTTERGADKREAILQAALELFVERGFHGTAVPEVADRAVVGAGTIYRYFASKEALVNELYQRHKQLLTTRVLRDFPVGASGREQFGELWRRMVRYAQDEPLGFAFLELHNHASYLDDTSKQLEERITAFGLEFIRQAQARGDLRPVEPLLLIGIVMGAFIGLVRKSAECHLVLDEAAWHTAEQCVWEAIRV